MSVKIIVDSTSDLTPEVQDRVIEVPITICFGNTAYVDGVEITNKEFYEKLIENDVLPTTSQPSPDTFENAEKNERQKAKSDKQFKLMLENKASGTDLKF